MAAKAHITIDSKMLQKKMKQYETVVGKEVGQLVRNGARLLCVELAAMTWPKQKAHGESRIGKDVSKIFTALNPKWWNLHVDKMFIAKKGGEDFLTTPSNDILADIGAVRAFHKANKRYSKGRELPSNQKAVVKISVRNRLVKELQKKVGLAKAGWAVAASLVKADVRQPMRGIPGWVTRNMGKAVATVDEKSLAGMSFKIGVTNKLNYVDKLLSKKAQTIAGNIARGKFVKMLDIAIRATKKKEAGLK